MDTNYDIYSIKKPSASGRYRSKARTNNMGDNPLIEPEKIVEGQDNMNALKAKLNQIGITDGSIAVGDLDLTDDQITVLMVELGYDSDSDLLNLFYDKLAELSDLIVDGHLSEDAGARFSYITDSLGNATVFDNDAGTSIYLRGEDANELFFQLDQNDDSQVVLSQYKHLMEEGKPTIAMVNEAVSTMFKGL